MVGVNVRSDSAAPVSVPFVLFFAINVFLSNQISAFGISVVMEFADVEFGLRQNAFGLSERIVFGRGGRSYLTLNRRTRVWSRWRLRLPGQNLRARFGCQTATDTADVRSEAGDAEGDPGCSSNHLRMFFMLCPPCSAASISGQSARI